jgi:uncharacterized protein YjbJ (UPF0337 family)
MRGSPASLLWHRKLQRNDARRLALPHRADRYPKTTKQGAAMNWDRIEGNWKQFTGKVKEQWGKLTDDEIAQVNGNREQLEGIIQARYGHAKDQVRRDVDDWLGRL